MNCVITLMPEARKFNYVSANSNASIYIPLTPNAEQVYTVLENYREPILWDDSSHEKRFISSPSLL